MPLEVIYSPNLQNFATKKKPLNKPSYSLWMEEEYVDSYNRIKTGDLPLFACATFDKHYLESLINVEGCHWVSFSPVILEQEGESKTSLWAVAVTENSVPLLGDKDKIVVATEVTANFDDRFPIYNGVLSRKQLVGISKPIDKYPDEYEWLIPDFEEMDLFSMVTYFNSKAGELVNPFLSISVINRDLANICALEGCEKVALIPIVLACRVKEDILPERQRQAFNERIEIATTMLILPFDSDGMVLPFSKEGEDLIGYGETVWPPAYRPWS